MDNFHFICHDCTRRAEDAKKPKIPTLKFHIGSSSSPPSQKVKNISDSTNGPKKRKAVNEAMSMPPMKKFKAVEVYSTATNPFASGRPPVAEAGMHDIVMNGPTLSPQGQVSPAPHQNGVTTQSPAPPPGLRSPPVHAAYQNGYTQHIQQKKENSYQSPKQTSDSLQGASNGAHEKSPRIGWSARYPSHETPQSLLHKPSSHSPFLGSSDSQLPSASHSIDKNPSPSRNRPSLSPPPSIGNASFAQTPITNGVWSHHLPSPVQPQSLSPVKHQSSPTVPAAQSLSSSPTIHPTLPQNAPSSPGFSPTKHSPPRLSKSNEISATPILPPVKSLSPSAPLQGLHAPAKALEIGEARPVNGTLNGE